MRSAEDWSIAIHGGAGAFPKDLPNGELERMRNALEGALEAARAVLAANGRSLDAVQLAVRAMERSAVLNAGLGAVLNEEGLAELDAALMDGRDRRAGAVAAVRHVLHPIDLARAILDHGRHVMLSGTGAERFARDHGLELRPDADFITARRMRELEQVRRKAQGVAGATAARWRPFGTVGAVALDMHGSLAAATSTGGITGKYPGRVGDSPILGAGTYAENGVCAVSATGAGEYFMRFTAASEVRARVKYQGKPLETAAAEVIAELRAAGSGRESRVVVE
ncbi:MAG: isoaspartyl peptidase/L-asparaginase family protein, partial [Steroidobacteraceae bacterium]